MNQATRNRRIVRMYLTRKDGRPVYTAQQIAKRYDISTARVWQIVKAADATRNRQPSAPAPDPYTTFWARIRNFFGGSAHAQNQ